MPEPGIRREALYRLRPRAGPAGGSYGPVPAASAASDAAGAPGAPGLEGKPGRLQRPGECAEQFRQKKKYRKKNSGEKVPGKKSGDHPEKSRQRCREKCFRARGPGARPVLRDRDPRHFLPPFPPASSFTLLRCRGSRKIRTGKGFILSDRHQDSVLNRRFKKHLHSGDVRTGIPPPPGRALSPISGSRLAARR